MQVTIAGEPARLEWRHNTDHTVGILKFGDGREVVAESIVHPLDRYVKEVGRKLTLARLLKTLELPKHQRELVWRQYHCR